MRESGFTAHAAGATLACRRQGQGAPLLLIMGVAGHQGTWGERFLQRLAQELEVITYDHRGIGESSPAEGFTLDDLLADAVAVLDWAGVADAHVLGFSMGSAVAQRLAVEHPERVRTLTLVAAFPDGDDSFGEGVLQFLGAGNAPDAETAAWMVFEANVSPAFAAAEQNFPPFRDAALSAKVPVPVVMRQMAICADHSALPRLSEVRAPTLVVHGTQDTIIRPSAGERLARAIPGARLELWPGVGHHVSWTEPDRLAEAVLRHTRSQ